jgi:3-oxoacyl-[acyl-carrier-protein] synthase III
MEINQDSTDTNPAVKPSQSFYERSGVRVESIPLKGGVPIGIEQVSNPVIGIGGAYGTWGEHVDNEELPQMLESMLGESLEINRRLNLAELGFLHRQFTPILSDEENVELEVQVGKRFLENAAEACGWKPQEVEAVLVGISGPVSDDYVERISQEAGIPDEALKVSVHKACDGSVASLNLALNPSLPVDNQLGHNLAKLLNGKKVLLGGIEGLSRLMRTAGDSNAVQLFGNGAGIIGLIPGKSMKFLAGQSHEVYDEAGLLAFHMMYPHSKEHVEGQSMIEVTQPKKNFIRIAGLMHEPPSGFSVQMAGMIGMVKLFVRSGVQVVEDVYRSYQQRMVDLGMPGKEIAVAIVHHANYKINQLIEKTLNKDGIHFDMPWLLNEFGNVSAASNMIAFMRKLSSLKPGDNILFDGFGAGTYYDVVAVELGG